MVTGDLNTSLYRAKSAPLTTTKVIIRVNFGSTCVLIIVFPLLGLQDSIRSRASLSTLNALRFACNVAKQETVLKD